jgi:hypothetical protein
MIASEKPRSGITRPRTTYMTPMRLWSTLVSHSRQRYGHQPLLGGVIWIGSHQLDPRAPIPGKSDPLRVDVVALDWKWLFIYPDQGVAAVNQLVIPAGTPVEFRLTSATVMNSFFVPQLSVVERYCRPAQLSQHVNLPPGAASRRAVRRLTDRRSDLGGREDRRRHLIEQWLKYVVVAAVNQDDLGIGVPQRVRRRDPGKATVDDHDALAPRMQRLHDRRGPIRPSVDQHRAHWVTFVCAVYPSFSNSLSRTVGRSHPYSSNERDGVQRENE